MSEAYDKYLQQHIKAVQQAFDKLCEYFPEYKNFKAQIKNHDKSKYSSEEYGPYDRYFYGDGKNLSEFDAAWLHHIHNNPHHWQHWLIVEDDLEDDRYIHPLEMPIAYIVEMICDWWSFSFIAGDLYIIFDWVDEHKDHIMLAKNTKDIVNYILNRLEFELDNDPNVSRKNM